MQPKLSPNLSNSTTPSVASLQYVTVGKLRRIASRSQTPDRTRRPASTVCVQLRPGDILERQTPTHVRGFVEARTEPNP